MIENAKKIYETRIGIIDAFKKVKIKKAEKFEDEETEEDEDPDIKWLYRPQSELNRLIENAPFEELKKDKNYTSFKKKLKAYFLKVF